VYQGVVGQTQVTVSCPAPAPVLQSINLYPNNPTIPQVGQTVDFLALAIYSPAQTNNDITTQATWHSGDEGVATVNAGLAAAVSCGSTTIQAEYQGVVGQMPLIVQCANNLKSIGVIPGNPTIPQIGQTTQFAAIGTLVNGSQQDLTRGVTWSSSNPQVATVDSATPWLVHAISCGTATISAESQSIVASTLLTISCGPVTSIELLVVKTGTTPSIIQDSTGAISCGAGCGAPFNEGTGVTLTASPTPVSWSGCDQPPANVPSNVCILTVRPDTAGGTLKTVTANYP